WDRTDASSHWLAVALFVAALAVLAWTILLGHRARHEPLRCTSGWIARGQRCCAPGQRESAGHCSGLPARCPLGTDRVEKPVPGCVATAERVRVPGGSTLLGPTDWDGASLGERRIVSVHSFDFDRFEVTRQRYAECELAGACSALPGAATRSVGAGAPSGSLPLEPGLPMTGIGPEQAEAYCRFAGGRLPTPYEWLFAATGPDARRYPWGAHGLVCRRATFGMVDGPCGHAATSPELAGARPEGATSGGIHDLAGNVAEYARRPDGLVSVHGGSFRSRHASELKSWSSRAGGAADDVGFRCAYDLR
ncbi:MAG TPA: SUMF1/EgtB/PvdO family nonheme iron enzyme, partial [Polyangiaceae bacterium]|nr:SUMF1/EgtB/PvdO family nonheme iron enzyme [Polyangiaceae bacterium]